MMRHIAIYTAGLLFTLGLGISGMLLPQKVIGFLDFPGAWDPSLGLVMASSVLVFLVLHKLVLRRESPLFDTRFHIPTSADIDAPLVMGAALFGMGWGIVGFCPGPAVSALASGDTQVWIFFIAMITGMYAEGTLNIANRIITEDGEVADA